MPVNATGIDFDFSRRSTGGVLVELTGPITIALTPRVIAVRTLSICLAGEFSEVNST